MLIVGILVHFGVCQMLFNSKLEQREKARKEWAIKKPTWCQQKKDILQFIEDNQSFCGVIHEVKEFNFMTV